MTDRVEVKTKADAMKALKAGAAIRIIGGAFSLSISAMPHVNIEVAPAAMWDVDITIEGSAELWGSSRAVLRGSSSAVLRESSSAVLRGSSSAVLRESSSAVLRESSSAVLRGSSSAVLRESSSAVLRESSSAVLRESSRAELWGSSSAELWGSSRAELWGSSRAELWGSSSAELWESSRAELWESSSAELWESSSAVLRGSSSAVLWGSSSAVLRESSSAELRGSSRANARGYSFLIAHGTACKSTASETVCVNLWNGARCEGGRQQIVNLSTNQDWCDYYGVPVSDGMITLYKGVGDNYRSGRGGNYTPGSTPEADKWDGGKVECSHGLHWSPSPSATREWAPDAKHFIAANHRLEDIVVHWNGLYPQKAMTRTVAEPVFEVDRDGNPIALVAA